MAEKFRNLLFAGFILHLLFSLLFIVSPNFFGQTRFSRIYKTYLLPGPFFSDDRIQDSYIVSLSWRINNEWTKPKYVAKENFVKYHRTLNVTNLYRSRLERSRYQSFLISPLYQQFLADQLSQEELCANEQFLSFQKDLMDRHVPQEADSVILSINRKNTTYRLVMNDEKQFHIRR